MKKRISTSRLPASASLEAGQRLSPTGLSGYPQAHSSSPNLTVAPSPCRARPTSLEIIGKAPLNTDEIATASPVSTDNLSNGHVTADMMIRRFLLSMFFFLLISVSYCAKESTNEISFDPYIFLASTPRFSYSYVEKITSEEFTVGYYYKFEINKEYGFFRRGYVRRGLEIIEVVSYRYDENGTYEATESRITLSPENSSPYTVKWRKVKLDKNLEITYPDGRVWEYRSATE